MDALHFFIWMYLTGLDWDWLLALLATAGGAAGVVVSMLVQLWTARASLPLPTEGR